MNRILFLCLLLGGSSQGAEQPAGGVELKLGEGAVAPPFEHYRMGFEFQAKSAAGRVVLRLDDDVAVVLGGEGEGKEAPGALLGKSAPEIDAAVGDGEWQNLEVTYERLEGKPRAVSAWMNGRQIHNSVRFAGSGGGSGVAVEGVRFVAEGEQNEGLGMSGDFTLMAAFSTKGEGTILARCNPEGKWVAGGKALYIRGGRLVYDIGWSGALTGRSKVNDGKRHVAVVVCKDGNVRMFLDGKLEGEKKGFSEEDKEGFVTKIGACADDFGGEFNGEVGNVRFYERELNGEEIAALSGREAKEVNTPVLNWSPGGEGEVAVAVEKKGPRIELEGEVEVRNAWAQALDTADHAGLVAGLDEEAFGRGKAIYESLCVTCHGTPEKEGSLPTALKFHEGVFKNGNSPYAMYRTLTHGFGMMVPQPQFDAAEKYEVIHYLREAFLKPHNKGQYVEVDEAFLASMPRPMTTYEAPSKQKREPQYKMMDFGPALMWTYQVEGGNIAYKAINMRLDPGLGGVSKGKSWMVFDHDTMRVAAAYSGDSFVDWRGIAFDGSHGTHTSIAGDVLFTNPVGPGWAKPGTEDFSDPRMLGRDGNPYGPLPREWAQYKGLYYFGNETLVKYTVGDAEVLEMGAGGWEMGSRGKPFTRTLKVGKSGEDLVMRVAPAKEGVHVGMPAGKGCELEELDGFHVVRIPAEATPVSLVVAVGDSDAVGRMKVEMVDLDNFTKGGVPRWSIPVVTDGIQGGDEGAFATDVITLPDADLNPWQSWMRMGGFDFFEGGDSAAVCTWMGDVWIVKGIGGPIGKLEWQRICTGLFQPLGVKIVEGEIYVCCRDQIAKLHDYNGDGETDFVECFNNDHQVTEHFHEFAMGLQTDDKGNFYYAKSARHALKAVVPHHGTLLRVDRYGKKTDIVANGFRAANGVCLNPDGTWIVTDQEGHWNPKNRINYVKEGGFYGNMFGYHDVEDSSDGAMEPPLCWITNAFDRSPAELLWVPKDAGWGALNGSLLNLSYGYGQVYVVPHEKVDGQAQGGMCALPMPKFPTGVMRGRFHPDNGQLYAGGLFAWAGSQQQPGGFYRVRATGKAAYLPLGLEAIEGGMRVTLSDAVDREASSEKGRYKVKVWNLKRTASYGSKHYDERELEVEGVEISEDGKVVVLKIPGLEATWGMEIAFQVKGVGGEEVERVIHNTVHEVAPRAGDGR